MARTWDPDDLDLLSLELQRGRRRLSRGRRQERTEELASRGPHRPRLRTKERFTVEREESLQINDLLNLLDQLDDETMDSSDWP